MTWFMFSRILSPFKNEPESQCLECEHVVKDYVESKKTTLKMGS